MDQVLVIRILILARFCAHKEAGMCLVRVEMAQEAQMSYMDMIQTEGPKNSSPMVSTGGF